MIPSKLNLIQSCIILRHFIPIDFTFQCYMFRPFGFDSFNLKTTSFKKCFVPLKVIKILHTPFDYEKLFCLFCTCDHRYLVYTRWRIPHCGQAKIEAGSQALVIPTELTRSMIICVFCIAKMDKFDNKSCFMQLKSI